MKTLASVSLAVAIFLAYKPLAWAADAPAPMPPMSPASFQAMEQAHGRIEQLHAQARLSVLNALTPAHRTLLAQVIGNLAIAPNPDLNAAARTLDANLTPIEARTILNVSATFEQQSRQIMTAAHQEMMKSMPPPPNGAMQQKVDVAYGPPGANESWRSDPGFVLIHMVVPPAGHDFFLAILHRAP